MKRCVPTFGFESGPSPIARISGQTRRSRIYRRDTPGSTNATVTTADSSSLIRRLRQKQQCLSITVQYKNYGLDAASNRSFVMGKEAMSNSITLYNSRARRGRF